MIVTIIYHYLFTNVDRMGFDLSDFISWISGNTLIVVATALRSILYEREIHRGQWRMIVAS